MSVSFEPVVISEVEDGDGRLAFVDGELVAVLVRLAADHGTDASAWFIEKGFGKLDQPVHPLFDTLEDAARWIEARRAAPS